MRRAQARPPRRAAGMSDWSSWYHSFPVLGLEAKPHGECEAPRQGKSERVDALAEVGFDAVQVGAACAPPVFIQLGIDAGVSRPEREVPHRRFHRHVAQSESPTGP